tara:strand:- start:1337 stop:3568 length:2232 start_codon:yes stop_codon:yes gene_type:complete
MDRIFAIITIFILLSTNLLADRINNIEINGNKRISQETIKVYGEIEVNKEYLEEDLNKILINLYKTDFFENVKIKISNNTLIIDVEEYPIINQLIIIGEKSNKYNELIKDNMKLKEKRPFVKSYLAQDVEIIKKLYSTVGYNSSIVEAKVKKLNEDSLDILIEISRGDKSKISSINFIGNKNIRSNRLKSVIASEEDKFWKFLTNNTNFSERLIKLDLRLLSNYYKSLGYYDIAVTSNSANINKSGKIDLIYSIDEGQRYIVNKISTQVDPVLDKKVFFPLNKYYEEYVGQYYSPFKTKKLLEELDKIIDNNDLQFVEHNVKETIEGDKISIIFNVFEGEKILVERINISGNQITNEEVIRGELILDEGDPFTKLNLEKSIAEIKARRIFSDVSYKVVEGSKNNLKVINISVEEQPTGEISAGAGVGSSGGTIAFNIQENNWLGEGKILGLDLEIDEEALKGTLRYTDPNYDFLGNSINYSLSSQQNDKPDQGYENSIISGSIGTSFEQYRNVKASLGLSASYDDLQTTDNATDSLKKQSGKFSEFAGSYGFTFDNRDRAFMPTNGSIINFNQSLPFYADKSFIANSFSASKYKEISNGIISASKIYLSAINGLGSDNVRLSKRRGLSERRLRGFEKNKVGPMDGSDHIGGNYAAAINFEANLPNLLPENTNTDVSLFLDFGNIWGVDYDTTLDESSKIRSSTGIAANWMSPVGPLSLVLSQNLSKEDTDETRSFSFNLGTTF